VALQYRTIRAAASALLIAVAVGAGGMTGMTSTLAADPTVPVTGTLVDGAGAALAGVDLLLTEELAPDGGIAAFQAKTGADGTFTAALYPWGTAQAPATLTIVTAPDQQITVIGEECSQTWSVVASARHDLAIGEAEAGAPEALTLTATTELIGEVCAVSATPPPGNAAGGADLTPPPTDLALGQTAATSDRLGMALLFGFAVGLALVLAFFTPRPGARRP
jgi:hypothetical protein